MLCVSDKRYVYYEDLCSASLDTITSVLHQFKETLQRWKTWDSLTIIKNHQSIKDYLVDIFQRVLQVCPSRSVSFLFAFDEQCY